MSGHRAAIIADADDLVAVHLIGPSGHAERIDHDTGRLHYNPPHDLPGLPQYPLVRLTFAELDALEQAIAEIRATGHSAA